MSKNISNWFWAESLRSESDYFTLDHDGGLIVDVDAALENDRFQLQVEGVRILQQMATSESSPSSEDGCAYIVDAVSRRR